MKMSLTFEDESTKRLYYNVVQPFYTEYELILIPNEHYNTKTHIDKEYITNTSKAYIKKEYYEVIRPLIDVKYHKEFTNETDIVVYLKYKLDKGFIYFVNGRTTFLSYIKNHLQLLDTILEKAQDLETEKLMIDLIEE